MIDRIAECLRIDSNEVHIINRLPGGRSHYTYLIEINGKKYVYRKIGKEGNLFSNRRQEGEGLKWVEPFQITPKVLYFNLETGEKIAEYLDGKTCEQLDCSHELHQIADTLKKLHHIPVPENMTYDLIKQLDVYESYTNQRSPLYLTLKAWWTKTYTETRLTAQKVFCHNDAQKGNILLSHNEIYLLDFEFVGPNEFYYDIASFGNQDIKDAFDLLDAYLDRLATKEEMNIVRFYRIHQALKWHQVALRKAEIGLGNELNLDFLAIANDFLNLAHVLYLEIKG